MIIIFRCVHPGPGITGIKGFAVFRAFEFIKFSQPEKFFHRVQFRSCLLPEIKPHPKSKVAAEPVDIKGGDPPFHGVDHRAAHVAVVKIKFDNIIHARSGFEIAGSRIAVIIFRVIPCPGMVPARMIGHPVDDHFHPHFMRLPYQLPEILRCSEFGIDGTIIAAGIITAQRAFFIFFRDRGQRHEPERLHAHLLQPRQGTGESGESALPRVLPQVHFINIGLVRPFHYFKPVSHIVLLQRKDKTQIPSRCILGPNSLYGFPQRARRIAAVAAINFIFQILSR